MSVRSSGVAEGDRLQDWGEQLEGVKAPKLFVADFKAGSILPVKGAPEGAEEYSAGLPVFSPDGKHIVYVGRNHEPYRLGMRTAPPLSALSPVA